MADAVLVSSSHPHRPLCASSCKLFLELAQEKCLFCVFPSPHLSLTWASFLFYMPPFFKTRLLSLWYWCTLTIDIDCQVDWVMFYIPRCGEVAACLIPVPFECHNIWCCWLCAWVLVCVCSLYNKWFAQLKVISAKKHFSTNNSCKNHDFIHAPWEY